MNALRSAHTEYHEGDEDNYETVEVIRCMEMLAWRSLLIDRGRIAAGVAHGDHRAVSRSIEQAAALVC